MPGLLRIYCYSMKLPRFFAGHVGDWLFAALAVVLILISLLFAFAYQQVGATPERSDDVADFVRDFGHTLQNVSLLAPDAAAQIEAAYGPYASRDLLDEWEAAPTNAPGRLTSSPWPDSIKVSSVQNTGVGSYIVKAAVIDRVNAGTTTQKTGETPILLGVIRDGVGWQIVEYEVATSS